TTSASRFSTANPVTSVLSGSQASVTQGQFATGVGVSELLPWGGSYAATWNNQRNTTTDAANTYNPRLQSTLGVSYTQPLVRNFKIDNVRQQVAISKKLRESSDVQLQATIVQTVRSVKNAYWDLAFAINNLSAQ